MSEQKTPSSAPPSPSSPTAPPPEKSSIPPLPRLVPLETPTETSKLSPEPDKDTPSSSCSDADLSVRPPLPPSSRLSLPRARKHTPKQKKENTISLVVGVIAALLVVFVCWPSSEPREPQDSSVSNPTPIFDLLRSDSFPETEKITHEERVGRSAGLYDAERIRQQLIIHMRKEGLLYLCMHHLSVNPPVKQLCAVQFDPPCADPILVDHVDILQYSKNTRTVVEDSTLRPGVELQRTRNDRVLVRWRDYETAEFMESYLKTDLSIVFQRIADEFRGIPIT